MSMQSFFRNAGLVMAAALPLAAGGCKIQVEETCGRGPCDNGWQGGAVPTAPVAPSAPPVTCYSDYEDICYSSAFKNFTRCADNVSDAPVDSVDVDYAFVEGWTADIFDNFYPIATDFGLADQTYSFPGFPSADLQPGPQVIDRGDAILADMTGCWFTSGMDALYPLPFDPSVIGQFLTVDKSRTDGVAAGPNREIIVATRPEGREKNVASSKQYNAAGRTAKSLTLELQ